MRWRWWKIGAIILLLYTVIAGFLMDVPRLPILNETIRSLYFHVPMWFGMIFLLSSSVFFSIRYLSTGKLDYDTKAVEFANTGILLGILGLLTGMVWAKYAWGAAWSGDPKQNGSAICLLIYLAYLVLRNALEDDMQRARISAVYNIFAFAALIPLLIILPRMTDSLHPGSGGNPGFNTYDLDSKMRMVFYPAVLGWLLLSLWITSLRIRIRNIKNQIDNY